LLGFVRRLRGKRSRKVRAEEVFPPKTGDILVVEYVPSDVVVFFLTEPQIEAVASRVRKRLREMDLEEANSLPPEQKTTEGGVPPGPRAPEPSAGSEGGAQLGGGREADRHKPARDAGGGRGGRENLAEEVERWLRKIARSPTVILFRHSDLQFSFRRVVYRSVPVAVAPYSRILEGYADSLKGWQIRVYSEGRERLLALALWLYAGGMEWEEIEDMLDQRGSG